MKRKVLSVLLAMLMIMSVLSIVSYADSYQPINFISIKGVTEPVAGAKPTFSANTNNAETFRIYDEYYPDTDIVYNGVSWYDMTDKCSLDKNDTFKAGHQYTVTVYLCITTKVYEGCYMFPAYHITDVAEYVNGKDAYGDFIDPALWESGYSPTYYVYYTFPALEEPVTAVDSVAVTGVTEPKDGQSPIYSATIASGANYQALNSDLITAIKWTDLTDNQVLNSVSKFKAGHKYRFAINLQAKDGCEFAQLSSLNGKVNNKTAKVAKSGSSDAKKVVELSYDFTIDSLPTVNFPDVKESAWYYEAVQYCAQRGFITGYQNGNFGPNDNLKRQDFVVILSRIAKANTEAYTACSLKDVKMNAYYGPAVAWAVTNNIVAGYANGNFGVNDNITREQVATILYRYMGAVKVDNVDETLAKFSDANRISGFAKDAVAWAVQNNIISGMADGRVAPTEGASRAQIATIIMNMDKAGMFPS